MNSWFCPTITPVCPQSDTKISVCWKLHAVSEASTRLLYGITAWKLHKKQANLLPVDFQQGFQLLCCSFDWTACFRNLKTGLDYAALFFIYFARAQHGLMNALGLLFSAHDCWTNLTMKTGLPDHYKIWFQSFGCWKFGRQFAWTPWCKEKRLWSAPDPYSNPACSAWICQQMHLAMSANKEIVRACNDNWIANTLKDVFMKKERRHWLVSLVSQAMPDLSNQLWMGPFGFNSFPACSLFLVTADFSWILGIVLWRSQLSTSQRVKINRQQQRNNADRDVEVLCQIGALFFCATEWFSGRLYNVFLERESVFYNVLSCWSQQHKCYFVCVRIVSPHWNPNCFWRCQLTKETPHFRDSILSQLCSFEFASFFLSLDWVFNTQIGTRNIVVPVRNASPFFCSRFFSFCFWFRTKTIFFCFCFYFCNMESSKRLDGDWCCLDSDDVGCNNTVRQSYSNGENEAQDSTHLAIMNDWSIVVRSRIVHYRIFYVFVIIQCSKVSVMHSRALNKRWCHTTTGRESTSMKPD